MKARVAHILKKSAARMSGLSQEPYNSSPSKSRFPTKNLPRLLVFLSISVLLKGSHSARCAFLTHLRWTKTLHNPGKLILGFRPKNLFLFILKQGFQFQRVKRGCAFGIIIKIDMHLFALLQPMGYAFSPLC